MRSFKEIHAIAAKRKGGDKALEALLDKPVSPTTLAKRPSSAWLEAMTKALFQAGFNWTLIEEKWPAFQSAFGGFEVTTVAHYSDADLDRLLADAAIVRNGAKISAVIKNAQFLLQLESDHGSASKYLASWPSDRHHELLELFAKSGARLGGVTGQRVCRSVGKDGYVLSADVCKRLSAEGVIDKAPTSRSAMNAVQGAFNQWRKESGRSLTEISQILARSVD